MRDIHTYSTSEWLSLAPLIHLAKRKRNDLIQNGFLRKQPPQFERFLQNISHLSSKHLRLIIAYQQPWTLSWLLRMAKHHLTDCGLLVFDNSRLASARIEIEHVCRDYNVPYLSLPTNPEKHPNRSHGNAMTWVFHRVVRAIRPHAFSYIDHDLIPLAPISFTTTLGDQALYGLPRFSNWGWTIWAGYCAYRFSEVVDLPLNFLTDIPHLLDTGGRNWNCLYSKYDPTRLHLAESRNCEIRNPIDGSLRISEIIDSSWLHLNGASYRLGFHEELPFYERLAAVTDAGATLQTLLVA